MKLYYNNELKELARKNRKAGNLSEALLWNKLKARKILGYQWTRQKPILDYILDFYCPKLKLAIEIDGSSHIDIEKDLKRQIEIEKLGIEFLRFLDIEIKRNLEGVDFKIEDYIRNKEKQPPNPL